jgi:hypothetical protein
MRKGYAPFFFCLSWMRKLPPKRPHSPLKRPYDIVRDPAAVKVAFLGLHSLAVHVAGVHFARIECNVVGERFVGMRRLAIEPGSVGRAFAAYADSIVRSCSLPFAKRAARRGCEVAVKLHVLRRDVVNGRVAGFQDAFGAPRIGDHQAIEDHLDMFVALLQPGWTWVVPY